MVLGAGESGVGAALLGKKLGWEVWVSDAGKVQEKYKSVLSNHGIPFEEGGHTSSDILTADEVVKSPGIPEHVAIVKELRDKGIPVIGEIELAGRHSKSRLIGITGTNGKTTTTLLTHHILKRAGLNVGLAGNVGDSFAKIVAEGDPYDWMVLEISSFQLDGMFDVKLDIAILLNITDDHLARYENDVMNYARSKMRVTQNQSEEDWFIYCLDDPITAEVMKLIETDSKHAPFSLKQDIQAKAFTDKNQVIINPPDESRDSKPLNMTIQELALQGKHNLYNSMASGIAARILEVRKDIIRECLSDFQNIEHRLERVNEVYGISFINDSKATNVNSTWYALESMSQPVIWIAGGVDKGNDYDQIKDMVKDKVKAIICLGKDNKKLHEAFGDIVEHMIDADNMRDAVYAAYKAGDKDDVVLLSPACASFDLFDDYEDRGRKFKEAVRNL